MSEDPGVRIPAAIAMLALNLTSSGCLIAAAFTAGEHAQIEQGKDVEKEEDVDGRGMQLVS